MSPPLSGQFQRAQVPGVKRQARANTQKKLAHARIVQDFCVRSTETFADLDESALLQMQVPYPACYVIARRFLQVFGYVQKRVPIVAVHVESVNDATSFTTGEN